MSLSKLTSLGFLTLLINISAPASAAPGSWTINGPYGGEIQDVVASGISSDRVYSSTFSGMFRSDDAGLNWQPINTGLPTSFNQKLLRVDSTPERIYTISAGKPHVTFDAGANWYERATGLPADVNSVNIIADPLNPERLYMTSYEDGLWTSANAGLSWTKMGGGILPDTLDSIAIHPADPDEIMVGVSNATDPAIAQIWLTSDAGVTWSGATVPIVGYPGIRSLTYATASDRYAGTESSELFHSADGLTWTATAASPPSGSITDLYSEFGNPNLIVAGKLGVSVTSDGGASFTDLSDGITSNGIDPNGVNGIDKSTSDTLYAGADFSGFYALETGDTVWQSRSHGLSATNIRAVTINPELPNVIYAAYGDAFFTPSAAFYSSVDSAGSWSASNNGLNASSLRDIVADPASPAAPATTILYAGGVGNDYECGMYKSIDGGSTWSTINSGLPSDPFTCYIGTIRSLVLDPSSATTPDGPLQTIYLSASGSVSYNSGTGIPTVNGHRIYKSTDAGATWTASDNGFGLATYDPGTFRQAYAIVIPLVIDPTTPSTLYAGTLLLRDESRPIPTVNNGVFKSTDGGANWVHMSNGLPRIGAGASDSHLDVLSLAIAPSDTDVLYASVSQPDNTSQVFKTIDGGANWFFAGAGILPTADTRALLVDPSNPDIAYAATGGSDWNPGGIYRTQNGGLSWVSISSDLERSSATALALDNSGTNPRLYVGTRGGVAEIELLPDSDTDNAEDSVEAAAPNGGDGNADGTADADQTNVASLQMPASAPLLADGVAASGSDDGVVAIAYVTIEVEAVSGSCAQLANARVVPAANLPTETGFELPLNAIKFELLDCQEADVTLIYHGAAFDESFTLRNYGPTVAGDEGTVSWYNFGQNATVSGNKITIRLVDNQLGDARPIDNAIMFQGAITTGEFLFDDSFEP